MRYPVSKKKWKESSPAIRTTWEYMYGVTREGYEVAHKEELKRLAKRATYIFLCLLAIIGLFMLNRHNTHTLTAYDVTGEVNLFPIDAESKNYRVKVHWTIDVVPRGIYGDKKSYAIDYITWPNGGTTEFPDCVIVPLEKKDTCEDIDFKKWRVEVHSDPLYSDPLY